MRDSIGKLLLRVMVGGMMLFHGVGKYLNGIDSIKGMVKGQGLPEMVAYGVYIGEIAAPLFIILGWKSRFWAMVVAFNMMVAIYFAHMDGLMSLRPHGAWAVEVPMFYFLGALAITFLGSGRYSISRD